MGCSGSSPFPPINTHSKSFSQDTTSKKKTPIISKRSGSISDFFDLKLVTGSNESFSVFKASDKESISNYSVKEISKSSRFESTSVNDEVSILNNLDHPNILKIFETIESPRSFYIVYEHIDGGPLKENVKRSGDEVKVARFMGDVLSGLNYMHKAGFIHCDLNIENIMISNKPDGKLAKIVGFTFARHVDDFSISGLERINPVFASPELLTTREVGTETDLWSLGIVLYTVLVGKLPFVGRTIDEILDEIIHVRLDFANPNYLGLSVAVRDLISKLLEVNPKARITAKDALNHLWIYQNREPFIINFNTLNRLKMFSIKSNLVRCLLVFYTFKMELKENDIVKCFKEIDSNFDGYVSRDELLATFSRYGINISKDIGDIMKNIDIDQSGLIDYSELKIVLTDWVSEIKKKNLRALFNVEGEYVDLTSLAASLPQVLPSEWKEFNAKVKAKDGKASLKAIKAYVLSFVSSF
jgi:calcium-dependent protein kinase